MAKLAALGGFVALVLLQGSHPGLVLEILKKWIISLISSSNTSTKDPGNREKETKRMEIKSDLTEELYPPVQVQNENVEEAHTTINFNFNYPPEELPIEVPMSDGGNDKKRQKEE